MTVLLIIIFTIVLIFGSAILCSFIIGYMENREKDELWIERYMDYIEDKGKELAERRNRRTRKNEK